jgi:hypothetical protein
MDVSVMLYQKDTVTSITEGCSSVVMSTTTEVEKLMMAMLLTDFIKSMRLTNLDAGCGLVEQGQTAKAFHIHDIGLMSTRQLGRTGFHLNWCMGQYRKACMFATSATRRCASIQIIFLLARITTTCTTWCRKNAPSLAVVKTKKGWQS